MHEQVARIKARAKRWSGLACPRRSMRKDLPAGADFGALITAR